MANFALLLKEEIRRLARKEIRLALRATKQQLIRCKREIRALQRLIAAQDRRLDEFQRRPRSATTSPEPVTQVLMDVRFSRRSVKAQRRRLGLSAQDYGRLIGVTGLTIYNWEQGKSRPRAAQLESLVKVRNIGRREAKARLQANGSSAHGDNQ